MVLDTFDKLFAALQAETEGGPTVPGRTFTFAHLAHYRDWRARSQQDCEFIIKSRLHIA